MNYPRKSLKKILISLSLLILTLPFATNALANEPASTSKVEQDAGPYHLIMETNPGSLMSNEAATMTMIIQDKATGQPVTGAKVMMKSTMKSGSTGDSGMAGMGMSSSTDKKDATATTMQEQSTMGSMAMVPGTYMMEGLTFDQPGQWNQAMIISSSLGETTANFPITVGKSGPNLVFIGSVVGVVVVVGLLAAMLKRKKSEEV